MVSDQLKEQTNETKKTTLFYHIQLSASQKFIMETEEGLGCRWRGQDHFHFRTFSSPGSQPAAAACHTDSKSASGRHRMKYFLPEIYHEVCTKELKSVVRLAVKAVQPQTAVTSQDK
jgi:hypothetical protein